MKYDKQFLDDLHELQEQYNSNGRRLHSLLKRTCDIMNELLKFIIGSYIENPDKQILESDSIKDICSYINEQLVDFKVDINIYISINDTINSANSISEDTIALCYNSLAYLKNYIDMYIDNHPIREE